MTEPEAVVERRTKNSKVMTTSASRTRRVAARALAVAAAVAACAAAGADAAESRKVSARGPRKASPGGLGLGGARVRGATKSD